jgi:hypothetical protein
MAGVGIAGASRRLPHVAVAKQHLRRQIHASSEALPRKGRPDRGESPLDRTRMAWDPLGYLLERDGAILTKGGSRLSENLFPATARGCLSWRHENTHSASVRQRERSRAAVEVTPPY